MGSCKDSYQNKAVRLKDEIFPHVKIRDWIIKEIFGNGHLLLGLKDKNYTLEVRKEDVEVKCCH